MNFLRVIICCFITVNVSNAFAYEQYIPNVPDMDAVTLAKIYPDVPTVNSTGGYITIGYPSSLGSVPTPSSEPMFIKVLLPPGTKLAGVGGESGSFTDQYSKAFPENLTPEKQAQCTVANCLGSAIGRINGALSEKLYEAKSPELYLTGARYATLVLVNTASSFSLKTFIIQIKIENITYYKAWRDARSWAGGESKGCPEESQSCKIDGVGQIISFSELSVKPVSDTFGSVSVKCGGAPCPSSVLMGTSVGIAATPKDGFSFMGWNCVGATLNNAMENPTSFVVGADKTTTCNALFGLASSVAPSGDITNQPVKATLGMYDLLFSNDQLRKDRLLKVDISSDKNLVNVFTRLDELPTEGFKWVDIGVQSPFANISDIPNGVLPNNPATMNVTLALANGAPPANIEAVVIAAMDGDLNKLKYKKPNSAASFDFRNSDVWEDVMLNDFGTTNMAYKTFNAVGSKTYSVLAGAGNIKLPRENSSVWLFSGYRTKIDGTYRYILGYGATPINVTPAYDMKIQKGITAYVPSVGSSVGTTEQITKCELKNTTAVPSVLLATADKENIVVSSNGVELTLVAQSGGIGKPKEYACAITIPAASAFQWADVVYTLSTNVSKTVSIKVE